MAGPVATHSIWNTNHGRRVRLVLILALVGSVLMMIVSGLLSGPEEQKVAPAPVDAPSKAPQRVAAAVANPFEPYGGINDETGDPNAPSPDPSASTDQAPVDAGTYQAMMVLAAQVVPPYASYTFQTTPEQYVNTIPGLSPTLRKNLTKSAAAAWPSIQAQQVVATARPVSSTPRVVFYREAEGAARVAVTVVQDLKGATGESVRTPSYPVDLRLTKGEWSVVGLAAA